MNMKRRYLISTAFLAACVGFAIGIAAMMPSRPGVTKANFDRIQVGMSKEEVMAILGEDLGYDGYSIGLGSPTARTHSKQCFDWIHYDNGPSISIEFDGNRAGQKVFRESTETFTDKLRRWLHLST
jgi:hypothetical protein